MAVYLVRFIKSKDLVGIYSADRPASLFDAIDEFCDPGDCEYINMPAIGGIYWSEDSSIKVPSVTKSDEEDDKVILGGATFSETWWETLHTESKRKWKRLDSIACIQALYGTEDADESEKSGSPLSLK